MNESTIPQTRAKEADENSGPGLVAEDGAKKATKVAPEQEPKLLNRAPQQEDDQISRKKSVLSVDGVGKQAGLQAGLQLVQSGVRTPSQHASALAVPACASSDVPATNSVTLSRAIDAQKRIAISQSWPATNSNASHVTTAIIPGRHGASLAVQTVRPTGHPTTPTKTVAFATNRQSPSQTRSPRPIAMKPANVPSVPVRQLNLVSSVTPARTVSAQILPVLSVIPATQSSNVTPISGIRTLSTGSTPQSSSPVVILAPQSSGAMTMLPAGTVVHASPIKASNILETPKPAVSSTAATVLASTSVVASGSQAGGISFPPGVRRIVITPQQQQYLQRQAQPIATFITPQQLQQTAKTGTSQKLPLLPKNTMAIPVSQPSRTLVHIQPKPSQILQGTGTVVQSSQNFTTATLISIAPQVGGNVSVQPAVHAVAVAGSNSTTLPAATTAISDRKTADHLINAPISVKARKKCNCSKSQCLKLYCECFANGEFCDHTCNCQNCRNTLEYQEERSKAIKQCLDRNPFAFHPKIGKSRVESTHSRSHIRGCNCKRSGCLKNYCECYEAKVLCTSLCRCCGCKNFEESPERKTLMHLADAAEVRKQQQRAAKAHLSSQIDSMPSRIPTASASESRLPFMFITPEVIEATCRCLLAKAEDAEETSLPQNAERAVLQEFGRCLTQIIHAANRANRKGNTTFNNFC